MTYSPFVSAVLAYKPMAEVLLAGLVWEENIIDRLISQARYRQLQPGEQADYTLDSLIDVRYLNCNHGYPQRIPL